MVRTGAVGAAGTALGASLPVLALCCATPAATTLALGAAGVAGAGVGLAGGTAGAWPDWLWLLVPPLLGFLALLAYGLHRQDRAAAVAAACRGPELGGGGTAALPNAG